MNRKTKWSAAAQFLSKTSFQNFASFFAFKNHMGKLACIWIARYLLNAMPLNTRTASMCQEAAHKNTFCTQTERQGERERPRARIFHILWLHSKIYRLNRCLYIYSYSIIHTTQNERKREIHKQYNPLYCSNHSVYSPHAGAPTRISKCVYMREQRNSSALQNYS